MNIVSGVRWTLALSTVAALGFVANASGQGGQPPAPAKSQMDELIAEVRAIRADLDRASAASLRGQLLGMRLQLQEQRITTLARQLSEVQQRLRDNAQTRAALQGPMKMFAAGFKDEPPNPERDEKDGMKMMLGQLKQQLAALDKADAELKVEESSLMAQLQDEQNRWMTFNGQIEEMERATAGRMRDR
jgi:hypothetical protein